MSDGFDNTRFQHAQSFPDQEHRLRSDGHREPINRRSRVRALIAVGVLLIAAFVLLLVLDGGTSSDEPSGSAQCPPKDECWKDAGRSI